MMVFRRAPVARSAGSAALRLVLAAVPLSFAACDSFNDAMTSHTDVVASAAGKEFKVADAAQLMASNPQIPAEPQVVRALADVWVDYTLLATAAAEDPTLAGLDLDRFLAPAREQMVVMKLREQVVRPDTVFTDAQLQQRWATEGPGAEIRARHILLRRPEGATAAQTDSLRRLAESLRTRATAGEDFAALATQYSEDPGSAQSGGDLGFFGRGRMVAPFDEAAFALQPGQISPVVESPFGYHIIRVEERRQQDLGAQAEEFRRFLVQRSAQDAETAYLDSLSAGANVVVQPDALEQIREIARNADRPLRGRAAQRALATYTGGELTSGEFGEYLAMQPAQVQDAFVGATDEQLEGVVQQLANKELLLREAERRGVRLTAAEQQTATTEARGAIQQVLQSSGLVQPGARLDPNTIEARVRELIEGAVSGTRQLVPLGPLGVALRQAYPSEIHENTFPLVVQAVQQIRPAASPAPAGPPAGMPMPPTGGQGAAPVPPPMQ